MVVHGMSSRRYIEVSAKILRYTSHRGKVVIFANRLIPAIRSKPPMKAAVTIERSSLGVSVVSLYRRMKFLKRWVLNRPARQVIREIFTVTGVCWREKMELKKISQTSIMLQPISWQ